MVPPKDPNMTRRERKAARNADLKARRPQRGSVRVAGKAAESTRPAGGLSKTAQKRRVNKGSR